MYAIPNSGTARQMRIWLFFLAVETLAIEIFQPNQCINHKQLDFFEILHVWTQISLSVWLEGVDLTKSSGNEKTALLKKQRLEHYSQKRTDCP